MWQIELNDLELVLIAMQCIIQTNLTYKKRNVSYENHFASKPNNIKFVEDKNLSISATSISEVTGVPRATCIRKLEKLNKMKIIKKDNQNKRYYVDLKNLNSNSLNSRKVTEDTIEMFSEFYLIVLKALIR